MYVLLKIVDSSWNPRALFAWFLRRTYYVFETVEAVTGDDNIDALKRHASSQCHGKKFTWELSHGGTCHKSVEKYGNWQYKIIPVVHLKEPMRIDHTVAESITRHSLWEVMKHIANVTKEEVVRVDLNEITIKYVFKFARRNQTPWTKELEKHELRYWSLLSSHAFVHSVTADGALPDNVIKYTTVSGRTFFVYFPQPG